MRSAIGIWTLPMFSPLLELCSQFRRKDDNEIRLETPDDIGMDRLLPLRNADAVKPFCLKT